MPYNFDSFHTKKLCSRLSSSEMRFYTENGSFAFLSPHHHRRHHRRRHRHRHRRRRRRCRVQCCMYV